MDVERCDWCLEMTAPPARTICDRCFRLVAFSDREIQEDRARMRSESRHRAVENLKNVVAVLEGAK